MFKNLKKIIFVFVLGALLGSIGDAYHAFTATAGYKNSSFFGIAWWAPLLFGGATLALTATVLVTDHFFRKKQKRPTLTKIIFGLIAFESLYLLSGYLNGPSASKTTFLFVLALLFVMILDASVQGFVFAIFVAACGTFFEMNLVTLGNFYYTHPEWQGVPFWLPSLYLLASVALANTVRFLFYGKRIYVS